MMKKNYIWPLVLALFTWVLASCNQEVEPKQPLNVHGQYHAVYVADTNDLPHIDINLEMKKVTDSTYQAQMAFYHYYKDNLLYSEVTNTCEPVINNDTVLLDFVMSEGKNTGMPKPLDRKLNVAFLYDNDALKLLSSSDSDILPDGKLLFNKAMTREDSAAIHFDLRLPRTTMVNGMYFINGSVKKFSASSTNGATFFEYYFDENGVVTGYKDAYGKMYNYEVGEIGEGVYYSLLKQNGWKSELSYNAFQQLISDNTKLNLYSYYYDHNGRMTDGYYKNSRTFYSFELKFDAHGTLIGLWNKSLEKYEMKYIVKETDNYGNPLEQSIDYCNGRVSSPCHYEYEYYE